MLTKADQILKHCALVLMLHLELGNLDSEWAAMVYRTGYVYVYTYMYAYIDSVFVPLSGTGCSTATLVVLHTKYIKNIKIK